MSREELEGVEEANALLLDEKNQLISKDHICSNAYRVNHENHGYKEWAIIAECISAARFLSQKETERLIDVLGRALHPQRLEMIKKQISNIQREKIGSVLFHSNFERINRILSSKPRYKFEYADILSFDYLTYSIEYLGNPITKQSKEHFEVHPHKIINREGLYYLLAYDDKKRKMRFFRIDRMMNMHHWDDEKHSGERLAAKMDFPTLTARTFDMCFGESTRVTLRCANSLFDTIYERFGTDNVLYRKCGDKEFEVTVVLDVSPKFYGWLCGFGKDAKLVSPPAVVDEFYNYIDEIKGQYNSK
jgi:predicted DNA-binding transcriptional regulator YafY